MKKPWLSAPSNLTFCSETNKKKVINEQEETSYMDVNEKPKQDFYVAFLSQPTT